MLYQKSKMPHRADQCFFCTEQIVYSFQISSEWVGYDSIKMSTNYVNYLNGIHLCQLYVELNENSTQPNSLIVKYEFRNSNSDFDTSITTIVVHAHD